MSLPVFRACIQGYTDHLFDLQVLGVQQGYWAGYFHRAKKPKSLKSIISKMYRTKIKDSSKSVHKPEVDVEAFQQMERQFKLRQQQQE